jgi:hypothetical protein
LTIINNVYSIRVGESQVYDLHFEMGDVSVSPQLRIRSRPLGRPHKVDSGDCIWEDGMQ